MTQTNIVKNVSGIYQYELARFRTGSSGITNFQDMRTFLDFDSIYEEIKKEIDNIKDGSAFMSRSNFVVLTDTINLTNGAGSKFIKYPSGFNQNNCVVISVGVQAANDNSYSFFADDLYELVFQAKLMDGFIRISSISLSNSGSSGTTNIIVVLMKK